MALTDVTALLNASEATYSMAIGRTAVPTDGKVYALNLLTTELSSLHNGTISVDSSKRRTWPACSRACKVTSSPSVNTKQATHNGSTAHISFGDTTTFPAANNDVSRIQGNVTSHSAAQLRFRLCVY